MSEQPLWFLRQHFGALQGYRGEIRRLWRDEAAREMNARYFDPQESDGDLLQAELGDHAQVLDQAAQQLTLADDHGQAAAAEAEHVAFRLAKAEQEQLTAYQHLDVYAKDRAEAVELFPLIINLVDEANHCCNGVGADPQGAKPTLHKYTNSDFAGSVKPVSEDLKAKYPDGVRFDAEGFPDFSPYAVKTVRIHMTGTTADFAAANKAAGYSDKDPDYTWHHHQDRITMQLVPKDLHGDIRHTGGCEQVHELGALSW